MKTVTVVIRSEELRDREEPTKLTFPAVPDEGRLVCVERVMIRKRVRFLAYFEVEG